jgi:hypothetical protein
LWWCLSAAIAAGQGVVTGSPPTAGRDLPVEYQSRHFVLTTDLAAEPAAALLERMEAALADAVEYWRRPARGQIDCYVVRDLHNWPDYALPHPLARVVVNGIGGATLQRTSGRGRTARDTALLIASAAPGVAEHEVIHAYCAQNFGEMGPPWYKEGMAEMAVLGHGRGQGPRCSPAQLDTLRNGPAHTIHDIVSTGQSAQRLTDALDALLAQRGGDPRHVRPEAWTATDADNTRRVREEYLWNWALCYLLRNNPNYSERFRLLGGDYLTKKNDSFERLFTPMADEIMFEYAFFLQRIDSGFRVDLCRWDWHTPARPLDDATPITNRCLAARGWQASEALVTAGSSYDYEATGTWSAARHWEPTDADGHADGSGRLVGVVMRDFQLSEPFPLGCHGSFFAPMSGQLYLRCEDSWSCLGDNRGEVSVRLTSTPAGGE